MDQKLRNYLRRIGRKGAAEAKKTVTKKDRQRWGKMGGRPKQYKKEK
jgi:hypothetical protein